MLCPAKHLINRPAKLQNQLLPYPPQSIFAQSSNLTAYTLLAIPSSSKDIANQVGKYLRFSHCSFQPPFLFFYSRSIICISNLICKNVKVIYLSDQNHLVWVDDNAIILVVNDEWESDLSDLLAKTSQRQNLSRQMRWWHLPLSQMGSVFIALLPPTAAMLPLKSKTSTTQGMKNVVDLGAGIEAKTNEEWRGRRRGGECSMLIAGGKLQDSLRLKTSW